MTRVVPDTNVIISSIFWRGNPFEVVKGGLLRKYQLVSSTEILDEVIGKLRNKFHLPEDKIQELIDILLTYCNIIETNS